MDIYISMLSAKCISVLVGYRDINGAAFYVIKNLLFAFFLVSLCMDIVISRASFCCTENLKELHLFLTKVAKSCIYAR